ncbi:cyclic nucleotide-binding domain-containing protein [Tabrizicola sp.]|uniref:SLC26A/SulP transporter family protein n=1 Tax=Tabrizicola sp. TaxID=2005166 RepID=UPI00286A7C6C|nr:cyclic nucleotide-binding domain-containing protein [Tabrizicola sp.]
MPPLSARPASDPHLETGPLKSSLVGLILGVDVIGHCLALATICFSGAMVAGLGLATALFILASMLCTLVLFRFGGFRIGLAVAQDTTISILAPAVALAASMVTGPAEAKVATALATIGVSAVASGAVFWLIGRLGLGSMVRMFPYPVAAGFLASSGFLLVFAAFTVLTGQSHFATIGTAALDPTIELRLFPAMVMAVAMIIAMRIWSGASPVLIIILLAIISYYATTAIIGIDHAEAVALGMLPAVGETATGQVGFAMLGMIVWLAVAHVAPTIAAVVLLNLIGMLLNTSGVELATRADIDENRELRVTGLANIFIGGFGGLTSFVQGGGSVIAAKLLVNPRALLIGHTAILLCAVFVAPLIVAVVPSFIPGAMLMFIGLSMLDEWLLGTRKRLTLVDWLIVVAIVLATATLGILPAIGIGLLLALIGFAFAAIRLPILRSATNVAKRRSVRDRSVLDSEELQREGHRVPILHLQGPLFFGSVEQLISNLRKIASSDEQIQAVIIDFAEVHSFDSSACAALDKLLQILSANQITAHVTGISTGLLELFQRWGLHLAPGGGASNGPNFQHWLTLDAAIEHCETLLLVESGTANRLDDIARTLFDLGRQHPRTAELIAHMQHRNLIPGEVLIHANEVSLDVYFLVSGRLAVHLPETASKSIRVRSMAPGAIVGEIACLTGHPRNANVICEETADVLCLASATIRQIEADDRDLAALMMSIFGRSLAVKLAQTNSLLTYIQTGNATDQGLTL